MEKRLLFIFCLFITIFCNQGKGRKVASAEIAVVEESNENGKIFAKELLQGVWAGHPEENAIFYIKGDSLIYLEDQSNPHLITLKGNILTINESSTYSPEVSIIKLDLDSLCFTAFGNTIS